MRTPFLLATALALSVASGTAQTKLDVKDIENQCCPKKVRANHRNCLMERE
jgi:hypothetical protein